MDNLLFLPLICGFSYALSGFLTKRALMEGAGILRFSFLSNWVMLLTFSAPLLWQDRNANWSEAHWPVLAGGLFFCGQVFTFAAIRIGDVSIHTPLMGIKVLMVALFAFALGVQEVNPEIWVAAVLSTLAVLLLGFSGASARGKTIRTIVLALLSAASFALADIFLVRGARSFGPAPFLAVMMVVNASLSLGLIPFFRGGLRAIPTPAWRWVAAGALLLGLQSAALGFFFAHTGLVAEGNILYSSRGIWSVFLGLILAGILRLENERMSSGAVARRLVGALLMSGAIWVVLK